MKEAYKKKIQSINPWIRLLCVVLAAVIIGVSTNLIVANLVPPLSAQGTLTLDGDYVPEKMDRNGLSGYFASQSIAASKDDRVMRLLLEVSLGEDAGQVDIDARYEELKPLFAEVTHLEAIGLELDDLIANAERMPKAEAELAEANAELNSLYEQYSQLSEKESALQKKRDELADCGEKIASYLTEEALVDIQSQIAELEQRQKDQQAELNACDAEVDALKAEQKLLKKKLDVQEHVGDTENAAATEVRLEEIKAELDVKNDLSRELKAAVNETKSAVKDLQRKVKAAQSMTEADVEAAKAKAETLRAELTELEKQAPKKGAADKMMEDIAAANEKVMTLTNEISALDLEYLMKVGEVPTDTAEMPEYIEMMRDRIAQVEEVEKLRGYLTLTNLEDGTMAVRAMAPTKEDAIRIADLYGEVLTEKLQERVQKTTQDSLASAEKAQANAVKDVEALPGEQEKNAKALATAETNLQEAKEAVLGAQEAAALAHADLTSYYQENYEVLYGDGGDSDVTWEITVGKRKTDNEAHADAMKAVTNVENKEKALERAETAIAGFDAKAEAAHAALASADEQLLKLQGKTERLAQGEKIITSTAAEKVPSNDGRVIVSTVVAVLVTLLVGFALLSGQPLFDSLNTVFFVVFTIICVFPFYYLFINTISDNNLVTSGLINFFPQGIHLKNYADVFKVSDIPRAFVVTTARTVIGTALMVLVSAWAGYLVTKQKMWRRSFMYRFLVMTMYFNAGLIPWYMNMFMLGLTDTFLAYILPGLVAPYNIILVKTYIESIPASLEESAIIDGANTPTVFTKIILPLSVPILATIAIFGAVGNWNSFQDSLLLMSPDRGMETLQHRLYIHLNSTSAAGMQAASGSGGVSQQMAESLREAQVLKYTISMVTVIPILLVYPFMQRFFVKGIMLGAVKG